MICFYILCFIGGCSCLDALESYCQNDVILSLGHCHSYMRYIRDYCC